MDELMVDKLGQLCGLVNHESVDWAVADGDGGNDGAVGAPVLFQSLNRNRSALQKPSCWRLWAKHPVGEGATPGGRSSGSEVTEAKRPTQKLIQRLNKGSRQILRI